MQCPYCAEEINDSAIVCRYCRRDFALLAPLLARTRELEAEIEALRTNGGPASIPEQDHSAMRAIPASASRNWFVAVASVLLSIAGSTFFYWLFAEGGKESSILLGISVAFPVAAGLSVGAFVPGRHLPMYLAMGAVVGLADFLATMLVYAWDDLRRGDLPHDWWVGFFVYFIGQALMLTLAAYFGDWIENRFRMRPLSEAGSTGVAKALSHLGNARRTDPAEAVEYWKTLLGALAPVFTLVGTAITAYFTYLAALSKGG